MKNECSKSDTVEEITTLQEADQLSGSKLEGNTPTPDYGLSTTLTHEDNDDEDNVQQ